MNLATETIQSIKDFAKLERILAAVCIVAPLLLIFGDQPHLIRKSISAYYSMEKCVLFYVPLTVAFMLFVVNGIVKKKRAYNTALGVALAGLVIFNRDDFPLVHYLSTAAFFLGNAAVIVIYSPKKELWFKLFLVAIVVSAIGAWGFGAISLFWAEWISLVMIGLHYILESLGVIE